MKTNREIAYRLDPVTWVREVLGMTPTALKVSDEFTVPLCRGHHRQLHQAGNEEAWWQNLRINVLEIARGFWEQTHPGSATKAIPHDGSEHVKS